MARILVSIVTHNEARDLERLLPSLQAQTLREFTILATDNHSQDGTRATLSSFQKSFGASLPLELRASRENLGYTGGHNGAIEKAVASGAEWVLLLNADVVLSSDYLAQVVAAGERDPRCASVTGKIFRAEGDALAPTTTLDTVGLRMTRSGRHFDVGAGQADYGQYEEPAEVFGVSGCVALYRVSALQDVKIETGYLDDDFFIYREDVDLAWRLRGRGWSARYVPDAVAWHRRRSLPERRQTMSPLANLHSVKNRFLLRINNAGSRHLAATVWQTFPRDLLVLAGCVTFERTSFHALRWLALNRRRLLAKRGEILARRTVSDADLLGWFGADAEGARRPLRPDAAPG
ncbi:MAG: glycosyltransferase family 2 protein [Thermoanaerobaculia bacterium]